jgi:carbamoyl-phosphate synthase large subunit
MKVLVTAIGSMSGDVVIKSLRRTFPAKIHGTDIYPPSWIPASRLVDRFHQVSPAKSDSDYIDRLIDICEGEGIDYLIPLTDPEVDIISSSLRLFHDRQVVVCIPPKSVVDVVRDKLLISRFFGDDSSVKVIETFDFDALQERGIRFPILAKPRKGRSSEGIVRIHNFSGLGYYIDKLPKDDYIFQPLLRGDIFVVDVVRSTNGQMASITREELLRTPRGAGITVKIWPEHSCGEMAREACKLLNVVGCVNLEFKVCDGVPLLMDFNPRFSAGVAFSVMAGYDMVQNHLRCFMGVAIDAEFVPRQQIFCRGYQEYVLEG